MSLTPDDLNRLRFQFPGMSQDTLSSNLKTSTARRQISKSGRVEDVIPAERPTGDKRHAVIKIQYPGCVITVNHYLGRMKNGNVFVKREAQEWADELTGLLAQSTVKGFTEPIKVSIAGVFRNTRETPDLHGMKLLYDTIQRYTGLNDRYYKTETEIPVIDKTVKPELTITITEV